MSGIRDVRRYRAELLARAHYGRLQAPVACYVRRVLGGAAECLPGQELEASYNMAWEALIEKMVQDSAPDCLEAWLRVVTYRKAVDHLRKRRSDLGRPLVDEVDGVGTVDDACDLASSREMVGTFLKRIEWRFGERSARIVACLWLEGLTHAAAAERVGVSTKRLRKILYGDGRKVGLRDELARLMEQFSASVDARPSTSRP